MGAGIVVGFSAYGFEPKVQPFRAPGSAVHVPSQGASGPQSGRAGAQPATYQEGDGSLEDRFLRAIMLSGKESMANVDGQLLRLGDELDGWRLRRLTENKAYFVRKGQRHVMELQRPGAALEAGKAAGPAGGASPANMVLQPGAPGDVNVSQGQPGSPVVSLPTASANPAPSLPALTPELLNKLIGSKN